MEERLPKYRLIYNDLRKGIFAGDYPSGGELPSESRLCALYGVSRETVRKATRDLENEGLIYSMPKVGYFVGKPDHSDLKLAFGEAITEGRSQYVGVHGLPADSQLAEALDVPAGHFVIQLCQTTYDSTFTPVAYEEKYLPYERSYPSVESEMKYAVFPDTTIAKMSTFTLYTSIRISAVKAERPVTQRLLCREGDPLLLVERVYVQQDERKIAYSRFYARQPYGALSGTSGNVQ